MLTPDEIRGLPAAWYAAQPIPARLLAALDKPVSADRLARLHSERLVRELRGPRPAKRSPVEQAHVRAANRLARGAS